MYSLDNEVRTDYLKRWSSLKTERSSWFSHWQELSQYILPRSGRFFITDRNRGDKRHNSIYDSTGTRALRVLAAGMMAGMTSPARPWFRLATPDKSLMEYAPVKQWLADVSQMMRDIFAKSNTYRALHSVYEELGVFGTGANIILPDYDNVIHSTTLTAGEYAAATDGKGVVNQLYREFEMTVGQMISEFGADNCSAMVRNAYTNKNKDAWVPVLHVIEPREGYIRGSQNPQKMAYKSCYLEVGGNENKALREKGFKRFPALAPRWACTGGDIYGNSPGMECLGDIKQLQHQQFRKAQGIDYMSLPPIQAPASMKTEGVNKLPGGVSYHTMTGANDKIQTAFDVRINLEHLLGDIQDVRHRIEQTFYVDLFLMLQQADTGREMTAREIAERHEEKLLMLGPVLERLHNEFLNPLIDITFDRMIEAHILPPPPQELHNQDLNVQFVSMLAQAQRAVGVTAIDRLIGTIGSIAQLQVAAQQPATALDKLDVDRSVDAYSDMLGVDPDLIVADDKIAIIRGQRAQAQAALQKAATAPAQAQTAKTLSETDTSGKNALTDLTNQFSGYTIPVGQGA